MPGYVRTPFLLTDFSEAENQFQNGRQHMSNTHIVLALYGQFTVWCKSAYYLALQSPGAHVKIKNCLHEALKIIEEIQRIENPSPSKNKTALSQCQQDIEHLFSETNPFANVHLLQKIHSESINIKNSLNKIKKRRPYLKPSLNVNRKKTADE